MDRLREAIGLGLVLGALHGTAASAVPVVPNFTQGSMTSHTETTQKIISSGFSSAVFMREIQVSA